MDGLNLLEVKNADPAGYALVRASLLQKMIRRAMLPEALWVADLYRQDGHERGLNRRLKIIAVEDIGLGLPQSLELLTGIHDFREQVALLCGAKKNRENDRFYNLAKSSSFLLDGVQSDQVRAEIKRARNLLLIAQQWKATKDRALRVVISDFVSETLSRGKFLSRTIMECSSSYFECSKANMHAAELLLSFAVLLSTRNVPATTQIPDYRNLPPARELNPIPEYVLDLHTPYCAARTREEALNRWMTDGCIVVPEITYPSMFDEEGKEKYPVELVAKIIQS